MFWLERPEYTGLSEILSEDRVRGESFCYIPEIRRCDPGQSLSDIIEQDKLLIPEEDVSLSKRKKNQTFRDHQQRLQPENSMSNQSTNLPITDV
jgi:hypothetical protein